MKFNKDNLLETTGLIKNIIGKGKLALQVTSLGWGGTERYVEDLSIAFVTRGMIPLVIVDESTPTSSVRRSRMESAGVEVKCLNISSDTPKQEYYKKLQEVIVHHDVRLLHANPWKHWDWIENICIRNEIDCLKTVHATISPSLRMFLGITWPSNNMWYRRLRALRTKPKFICTSKQMQDGLRFYYGKAVPTSVVYLGVPPSTLMATPECGGQSPAFTWVGSLIPRKNPLLMLRAFEIFLQDFPDSSLVIAGDGPLRGECEKYVKENLLGKAKVLGFVDKVNEVMAQSQVFVLTSDYEGLSYVNLEAMSAGLPVITTDCGSVTEAVVHGHTGLVVPRRSPGHLVKAMRQLSLPDIRKSMGYAGYERWKEHFSVDLMIEKTLQAYATLLSLDEH